MNKFVEPITELIEHCKSVLEDKHTEYATEDHFHNFNVAAQLQGVTPAQALVGMMDKHIVSVHDLVKEQADGRKISREMWREKFGFDVGGYPFASALINLASWGIPSIETVGRCRRKLQHDYPELCGNDTVEGFRTVKEAEFRDYARGTV